MRLSKISSVEQLQIISQFESLRKILLTEEYADHLEKLLAYWALPTDRRLPLALLGRSLRDLLNTPFMELSKTPGIGQKKIGSFVELLGRAANTDPKDLPVEIVKTPGDEFAKADGYSSDGYDPANVSEVTWSQWRTTVVKHGLENECLGRYAPSLKDMTRVIWSASLGDYAHSTLGEIRARKTHGEKRVLAILDVFHSLHVTVGNMGVQDHLVVRIVPRRIDEIELWIGNVLQTPGIPGEEEVFQRFVNPLLEQVRVDATQQIASLAENRLGITGPITSVRQAARTMGLTRARVYQLLNEINDIITVRWPHGRHQVYELREKFHAEASQMQGAPDLTQFDAAIELFYPGSRRGASGPLEQATIVTDKDLERIRQKSGSIEAEAVI